MRWIAVVLLCALPCRGERCRIDGTAWIAGRIGAGPGARSIDARRGETVTASVVAPGTLDGRRVLFSDAPGPRHVPWRQPGCAPVEVSWRRVEPAMVHTATRAPNRDVATYSNAVLFGPRHGEWIGWDAVEYREEPLDGSGTSRALTDARPSDPRHDAHGGLGVMRLAATVTAWGRRADTPGAADRDGPGVSDRVFRYTFRAGDGFLGWLTSFHNVPYLFASAGRGRRAQAERYIGADCADVLVAALRRAGRPLEYGSVASLVDTGRRVAGPVLVGKEAPRRLRFGADVRPGDLLVIDYVGWDGTPRRWDHVLVAVEDTNGDGWLDPADRIAHSGDATGLVIEPLATQGEIEVVVVRVAS